MRRDQRLLIALALALAACGGASPVEIETAPRTPVRVEVEQLTAEVIPQTVPLTGVVRARRQATLAAQVMGAVRRVAVEEGQRVSAGQPLIELDDQQFASGVAAARAMR
jgi:multidrug efflux pump subunit AcrA (membrane-fusion protein)